MNSNENNRQYRIIDQMISMHSRLRDQYHMKATITKISIIAFATFVTGLSLIDPELFLTIKIGSDTIKLFTGMSSLLIIILTVLELIVGWSNKSRSHQDAVNALSRLKSEFRGSYEIYFGENETENRRLQDLYKTTIENVVSIPDKRFITLKGYHLYKIEVSKAIDLYPGTPVWILKLKIHFIHTYSALVKKTKKQDDEE